MRIIPAIDIIDGKCVRLTQGDYSTKKIYNEDPLEVAKMFEDAGIRYLHLVDLDGAKAGRVINDKVLETLAAKTGLNIDFGGGVKSQQDINTVFSSGAMQVTIGSIAITQPPLFIEWLNKYGPGKIILGADCRQRKIMTQGWLNDSAIDVVDFIKAYVQKGIACVICTDISKDGMLEGPSFDLYTEILSGVPVKLVASGGISSIEDVQALKALGCEAAIMGKALYEGKINLKELAVLC